MNDYINVIKIAVQFFPFIALIISIPFILIQYHKFGSISFFKSLVIYSFTLYFVCAYFLVILPLPDVNEVALLTTPRMQLVPFSFINDFVQNTSLVITNIHTYFGALKETYFFVPMYNILLTLPFGIYLRYYFKCNMKKVILYSFLLSLFFELTQLSGLYFVYPRGYRLFDVDDLLLNTLGGIIGYLIAAPIIKILPKREKVDEDAKEKGKKMSGLRRTTTFVLDLVLYSIMYSILMSIFKTKLIFEITILIYYFIIPILLKGSTLGEKFLNSKILDYNDNYSIIRMIFRRIIFLLIYMIIPLASFFLAYNYIPNSKMKALVGFICLGLMFLFYAITGIKYLFTNKDMLYEKMSKTKLVSTIK